MKAFFRYHRGEFNGFYLRGLQLVGNSCIDEIKDELSYWNLVQFALADEVSSGALPIRSADLKSIAKIGGLENVLAAAEYLAGWFLLSESNIVSGVEYSERALFDVSENALTYVRTTTDEYTDDISTLATTELRMGLIPTGAAIIGYVWEGESVMNEDGTIDSDKLHAAPPSDNRAYTPYYGNQYLSLAEKNTVSVPITDAMFKAIFECLQRIKYNGVSIKEFFYLTNLLVPDYVTDIDITQKSITLSDMSLFHYYHISYALNTESYTFESATMLAIWAFIISLKFKMYYLSSPGESV